MPITHLRDREFKATSRVALFFYRTFGVWLQHGVIAAAYDGALRTHDNSTNGRKTRGISNNFADIGHILWRKETIIDVPALLGNCIG